MPMDGRVPTVYFMMWMSCGLGVALVPSLRLRMNGLVSSTALFIPTSVCSISMCPINGMTGTLWGDC